MHRIICYVKTLNSDGSVTVCGADGCYVEYKDPYGFLNKCNIFWLFGDDEIRRADSTLRVDVSGNLFQMLLVAKAENLKVELYTVFDGDQISIKNVQFI